MNVCVIGGSGHIGSHLVPMFVRNRINVTVVARGRSPLPDDPSWRSVRLVEMPYTVDDPRWREALREATAVGDTLIDLLGIDLSSTYETVREICPHVIACGSIWMLGMPRRVPCPPESQSDFWGEAYARRWKVIQAVLRQSAAGGPKFTAILPPNICGPGKIPLETRGGRSIEVHRALAAGETVVLPEGAEVLIGPCDAEDVAQSFYRAATQPEASAGRIFNVGSAYALTATEFVATYAQIYSVNIPIRRVNWSEFSTQFVPDPGSRYHFESHMCPDITDTRSRLGYKPRFTPEQAMHRAVEWMRSRNVL